MIEKFGDQNNVPPVIERMEYPAPLHDWTAEGGAPIVGQEHNSLLSQVYEDEAGRPLNPYGNSNEEPTKLRHEGANRTADIALLRPKASEGDAAASKSWEVLVIQRLDTGELALPGGFQDPGEDGLQSGVRELEEETGVTLQMTPEEVRARAQTIFAGPTLSPRARKHAWVETEVNAIPLTEDEGKAIVGVPQDDAVAVRWADLRIVAANAVEGTSVRSSHIPYFEHLALELEQAPEQTY